MLAEIDPFLHKELHQSEMNHLQKLTPFVTKKFIIQKWIFWHVLKTPFIQAKGFTTVGLRDFIKSCGADPNCYTKVLHTSFFYLPPGAYKGTGKGGCDAKKNVTPPAKLLCAPLFRTPLPPYWAYNFKKVRKRRVHAPLVPPVYALGPPFFTQILV